MLNYIKSEFYRVFHGKDIYIFTAVVSGLTLAINVILYLFNSRTANFPYGSIKYSLNILSSSMQILFLGSLLVTTSLFTDEYKNGTLKNTIAAGISRSQFFAGKCIVSTVMSFLSMVVILIAYIGSAYLLLDNTGGITVLDRLAGVAVNIPMACAAVILTVALSCVFKKEGTAVVVAWMVIMWGIPKLSFIFGLKVDWLGKAAEWMPWNYLTYETSVDMTQYKCLWDTPEGLAKCLIAGTVGIIVFYLAGVIYFRKKEIA